MENKEELTEEQKRKIVFMMELREELKKKNPIHRLGTVLGVLISSTASAATIVGLFYFLAWALKGLMHVLGII